MLFCNSDYFYNYFCRVGKFSNKFPLKCNYMAKKVESDFNMKDENVPVEGQRFLDQLQDNKLDFTSQYTRFIDPFSTQMQDDIDLCKASATDAACVAFQHVKTVNVEKIMNTSRPDFKLVFGYVNLAFPDNEGVFRTYGKNLYDKCKKSHTKFPNLLMQAYEMANDPETKLLLIAQGATDAQIQKLKTDSEDIVKAVRIQQKFMGARHLSAQDRVLNLNIVWASMVALSECAKIIYAKDYAMNKLFLLYQEPSATPPPPVPPVDPSKPE